MLHDNCQHFGTLPRAGGFLDQDQELMSMMILCVNYRHLARKGKRDAESLSESEWQQVEWALQKKLPRVKVTK